MARVRLIIALVVGAAIAYVDSRPTWDDTGITAGALLITCAVLGALGPKRPWLWALAVGGWIPALGILSHNYGSLVALVFPFAGAYGGMAVRRVVLPT